MNNLMKCNDCNEWMIAEEIEFHKCFSKLDSMLFDTDGTFSFDGKKWYRWLPTENQQRKSNTDNPTEPNFSIKFEIISILLLHGHKLF